MGDLKISNIPLGKLRLEKMDIADSKHMEAVEKMRDAEAVEMCYDLKYEVDALRQGAVSFGNHFLVRDKESYVGYMYISDDYEGERILAYIVEESVRGKNLGKVMLTSVSDYLFEVCNTSSINLYINKGNRAGIRLATSCGFESTDVDDDVMRGYNRKK